MQIYLFLRSQVKAILSLVAVIVLLGMVWSQTDTTSSQPERTISGAGTLAGDLPASTSSPAETPADSPVASSESPSEKTAPASEHPAPNSDASSKDDEYRAQLVGCWFHIESGEHWIENRADGTSRLLIKLDFVSSLLYGKRLEMDLTWEVKDGVLTHTILKGVPQANVDGLVKDFGKVRSSKILEVTPERMLLGAMGKKPSKDLWTRSPLPKDWVDATPK
jgi:hypothetical protein